MSGVVIGILTVVVVLHELQPGSQYTYFYIQHFTQVKFLEHFHANIVERSVKKY